MRRRGFLLTALATSGLCWGAKAQNGGDTGGYSAFIAYSTRAPHEAVLLANTSAPVTTPEIGKHLVNPAFPLPPEHRRVAIDPGDLAACAGRYAIRPRFVLTVRPTDGRLVVQATGQDEVAMFPESRTRFFNRTVDAQLTFDLDPDATPPPSCCISTGGLCGARACRSSPRPAKS